MDKLKISQCTGCGACENSCPNGCITMKPNEEGFLYPYIDKSKCVNCDLCLKKCPLNNDFNQNFKTLNAFAMAANDNEIRLKSSSGGIFTIIANYILNIGGIVYGAAYNLNCKKVCHIRVDNKIDLKLLQGSKYVQSEIGNAFKQVLNDLKLNKLVLFSGTPCQINGLNSYLGKKYDNLITVAIACHGVPSPLLFKKYLENLEIKLNNSITNLNFRNKITGWESFSLSISTNNFDRIINSYSSSYFSFFLRNYSLRKSCYKCKFKYPNIVSDFILGDFWGVDNVVKGFNDGDGCSFVIINSEKAKQIILYTQHLYAFERVQLSDIFKYNPNICKSVNKPKIRNKFYKFLNKNNYDFLEKRLFNRDKFLNSNYDNIVGVITIFDLKNYGNRLQNYATNLILKKTGYNIVNFVPKTTIDIYKRNKLRYLFNRFTLYKFTKHKNEWKYNFPKQKSFYKFAKCFTPFTTFTDIDKLKYRAKYFVTGSDQVWSPFYSNFYLKDLYFLNFADRKQKIALSPSISVNNIPKKFIRYYKERLNNFDCISIREDRGKEIIENITNKKATVLIDPTLMIDGEEWLKISKKPKKLNLNTPYILTYFLSQIPKECLNDIDKLKSKYKIIHLNDMKNFKMHCLNPSEFIYIISKASLILTDSYHGTIFSFLLSKPFVVYKRTNSLDMNSRFDTLFKTLNLERKYKENLNPKQIFECEYGKSYSKLKKLRGKFYSFVNKSIGKF